MGQITFQGKLSAAFGASLIILVCVGTISYRQVLQKCADWKSGQHICLGLEKVDAMPANLADEEIHQVENIITHEEPSLNAYHVGLDTVQRAANDLRPLTFRTLNSTRDSYWSRWRKPWSS